MPLQQTSLEAYRSIVAQLGDKQAQVFRCFQGSQPLTDKDLSRILNWPINCITPRRGELADRNMIKPDGFSIDPNTGRRCTRWKRTLRFLHEGFA